MSHDNFSVTELKQFFENRVKHTDKLIADLVKKVDDVSKNVKNTSRGNPRGPGAGDEQAGTSGGGKRTGGNPGGKGKGKNGTTGSSGARNRSRKAAPASVSITGTQSKAFSIVSGLSHRLGPKSESDPEQWVLNNIKSAAERAPKLFLSFGSDDDGGLVADAQQHTITFTTRNKGHVIATYCIYAPTQTGKQSVYELCSMVRLALLSNETFPGAPFGKFDGLSVSDIRKVFSVTGASSFKTREFGSRIYNSVLRGGKVTFESETFGVMGEYKFCTFNTFESEDPSESTYFHAVGFVKEVEGYSTEQILSLYTRHDTNHVIRNLVVDRSIPSQ